MLRSKRNSNRTMKGRTCVYGCCGHFQGSSAKEKRRYLRRVEKREWKKEVF